LKLDRGRRRASKLDKLGKLSKRLRAHSGIRPSEAVGAVSVAVAVAVAAVAVAAVAVEAAVSAAAELHIPVKSPQNTASTRRTWGLRNNRCKDNRCKDNRCKNNKCKGNKCKNPTRQPLHPRGAVTRGTMERHKNP
jgi:hypothetical protein